MELGLAFWIIVLVALLLGGWGWKAGHWWPGFSVLFVLILVLGWKVFGAPIHG